MSIRDYNKKIEISDITDDLKLINYDDTNKVFIELEYRDLILLKALKSYLTNKGFKNIFIH